MQNKEYTAAAPLAREIVRREPNGLFGLFQRAQLLYIGARTEKYKDRTSGYKFSDFAPQSDSLRQAYTYAQRAKEAYERLTAEERFNARLELATTEDEIVRALLYNIENEAYRLLLDVPYRKPTAQLYSSGIYNRETDAEQVLVLRESLLRQCEAFILFFTQSRWSNFAEACRKELLAEYLNIEELRRYGERDGGMYEKYCQDILKLFTPDELRHIVPQFYGAEFDIERLHDKSEAYTQLKALAARRQQEVVALLCELNLHHEGYTPEKEMVYDQFIRQLAPADIARIAVVRKAAYYVNQQQWEQAAGVHQNYQHLFPQWSDFFAKTIALLRDPTPPRTMRNLGAQINTLFNDYNPVLTSDGNTLYFSRKNADTGEDIYISVHREGEWLPARRVAPLSTTTHEVPVNITADDQQLIIYGNYSTLPEYNHLALAVRQLGKGDLYHAERRGNQWGPIQVFPYPINTPHYENGLTFTSDKQAVIFVSDRPGAVGGHQPNYPRGKLYYHGAGEFNLDLYVVERKGEGWGEPINLGETINTPYAESNPYLHPDMETLYFSSDGHHGLGGYDIYVTKRLNTDSWTEWSEPINLGKAINSPYDDSFYLSPTGNRALMVSSREGNGFGKRDIYAIEVPEQYQGAALTLVRGQFVSAKGQGVPTQIRWHADDAPEQVKIAQTERDGRFQVFLKEGKRYVLYADNEQLFGNSAEIDLRDGHTDPVYALETISLSPTDPRSPDLAPIILKTLHFDHDSDVIRPSSYYDLNRLAHLLETRSELFIRIEGHTDSDGDDDFNLDLSKRRARSVLRYLTERGMGQKIRGAEGFGEARPMTENETPAGKQLNRRVEFIIVPNR